MIVVDRYPGARRTVARADLGMVDTGRDKTGTDGNPPEENVFVLDACQAFNTALYMEAQPFCAESNENDESLLPGNKALGLPNIRREAQKRQKTLAANFLPLEPDIGFELHLTRRVGLPGHIAKAARAGAVDVGVDARKDRAVKEVERIPLEVEIEPLGELEVLCDTRILVQIPRIAQAECHGAWRGPEGIGRGVLECHGVEVLCRRWVSASKLSIDPYGAGETGVVTRIAPPRVGDVAGAANCAQSEAVGVGVITGDSPAAQERVRQGVLAADQVSSARGQTVRP